jgi:hypothetical protein
MEIVSENRQGTGDIKFSRISYTSGNQLFGYHPYTDGPVEISLEIFSNHERPVGSIAATIFDKYGTSLVNIDSLALGQMIELCKGINIIKLEVQQLHLNPGIYTLGLWAADPPNEVFDVIPTAALIEVVETEKQKIRVRSDGVVPVNFRVNNVT